MRRLARQINEVVEVDLCELAQALGETEPDVEKRIQKLVALGLIEQVNTLLVEP